MPDRVVTPNQETAETRNIDSPVSWSDGFVTDSLTDRVLGVMIVEDLGNFSITMRYTPLANTFPRTI